LTFARQPSGSAGQSHPSARTFAWPPHGRLLGGRLVSLSRVTLITLTSKEVVSRSGLAHGVLALDALVGTLFSQLDSSRQFLSSGSSSRSNSLRSGSAGGLASSCFGASTSVVTAGSAAPSPTPDPAASPILLSRSRRTSSTANSLTSFRLKERICRSCILIDRSFPA